LKPKDKEDCSSHCKHRFDSPSPETNVDYSTPLILTRADAATRIVIAQMTSDGRRRRLMEVVFARIGTSCEANHRATHFRRLVASSYGVAHAQYLSHVFTQPQAPIRLQSLSRHIVIVEHMSNAGTCKCQIRRTKMRHSGSAKKMFTTLSFHPSCPSCLSWVYAARSS
jgi:hypothetical protein